MACGGSFVWDRDFQDGVLVEAELSFWAQDDDGARGTSASTPRSGRTAT